MFVAIGFLVALAGGFGLGRVKHPANLKLSAVKAEIAEYEAEIAGAPVAVELKALLARIKSLL